MSVGGVISGNMDNYRIGDLLLADLATATSSMLIMAGSTARLTLSGSHFTYTNGHLTGGTLQTFDYLGPDGAGVTGHMSLGFSANTPIPTELYNWITDNSTTTMFISLFAGDDALSGTPGDELLRAFAGNDHLEGGGGSDTLLGGQGNDTISAGFEPGPNATTIASSACYLRGDDGDDSINGGTGFDDINGNVGNDTAHGGTGDDWVVGGKDQDALFGDEGNDIVWGNLGNDTLDGGNGNDQVRGGQGDDSLTGGPGNDYLSGDRGNDTIVGGPGADIFHSFSGAGIDRVMDFSTAEGDRVMLDPGTTYTVSQVGADVVIDMGNGDQMILQSVQLSSLPANWIFLG